MTFLRSCQPGSKESASPSRSSGERRRGPENELRQIHPIPPKPPVIRREVRVGNNAKTGRAGGQSARETAIHPRCGNQRQRLHLRDVGEHLPAERSSRRALHLAPSRFIRG